MAVASVALSSASNSKYTAQPWSCKDFDELECQQQMLLNLQEQYNTIFDCMFLPLEAAGGHDGLLLAAYQTGDVRLFNWRQVCNKWLANRTQQRQELSWRAHDGPVYTLALTHFDGSHLLVTAGGDGLVKLWRLADVLAAAAAATVAAAGAAAAAEEGGVVPLTATVQVKLPPVQNPLGISCGLQPSAQALAVDREHQQVFVGGSDGGVHAWQLQKLSAAVAALGDAQNMAAAVAALSLVAMPGHLAAVLSLDHCSATRQLASASEDGTVRVWDCNSLSCVSIIHPNPVPTRDNPGPLIPLDEPAQLLRCSRSPGNTCVRFDEGGNWLLIANAEGYLVLWSVRLNAAAAHRQCRKAGSIDRSSDNGSDGAAAAAAVAVTPQVLLVTPSSIYIGGTDKQLHQFNFQLEHVHTLEVPAESVFGIAQEGSSGMLAVCGSRGCLDLLSAEGTSLGHLRPPPSAFIPAPVS